MKRALRLLFFVAALLPFKLEAQPIVVRSGEHENFTRLVMRLPEGVNWQIETDGNKSTISLDGFDEGFDLTNAFAIIPRNRLTALVARTSELELQLGCRCLVDGFAESNGYLVVDIFDPKTTPDEEIVRRRSLPLPDSSFSFGELLWQREEPGTSEEIADVKPPLPEPDKQTEKRETSTEIVGQTRQKLVEAYSRAASTGLVDPKDDTLELPGLEKASEDPPEVFDASQAVVSEIVTSRNNIRVTSSKDVPDSAPQEHLGLLGGSCPDPSQINITNWATNEQVGAQIAKSNQNLFDEAGRLVEEEVLKRARLFIYFGFGAEANETLSSLPELAASHPELADISQVLEYGFMPNPRVLHRYADCNSDYALWGLLASSPLPEDQAVDVQAALRGLDKLPGHLKVFLAQDVSARLISRGDTENAMIAIRSMERLPENDADMPKLVNAGIAQLQKDTTSAHNVLAEIVTQGTPETPGAIIQIVEQYVQDDTPVPAQIALLAETYAFELRNSPQESAIFRAYVMAAAKSGQYDKAFETVLSERNKVDPSLRVELKNFVLSETAKSASDLEFLKHYYDHALQSLHQLEPETIVSVAHRLMDLGFIEPALSLAANLRESSDTPRTRLMIAELYLSNGEYSESLRSLETIETPEAHAIRARAQKGLGLHEEAVQSFQNAGEPEYATVASWLSETWPNTIDDDDPKFGPAKRVANKQVEEIAINDNMLEKSAAAIEASGLARDQLTELLDNLQVTE